MQDAFPAQGAGQKPASPEADSGRAEADYTELAQRIEAIARIVRDIFDEDVVRITAPGGRTRASVRVHLTGRTLIASWRPRRRRREMEAMLLGALHAAGGPAPILLGSREEFLFQSDAGSQRLTSEMERRSGAGREEMAAAAFHSLWQLKDAASRAGLLPRLPVIALNLVWIGGFVAGPGKLAEDLGLRPPELDLDTLAHSLRAPPETFIKWDARPGNAAVQPDGSVVWYDWEDCGRREGTEDFAFLLGDEFWPLPPEESLRVFCQEAGKRAAQPLGFLTRFVTLQAAQRLRLIAGQRQKRGAWIEPDRARRYDNIGFAPPLVRRLASYGADYASRDALTAPLAPWFETVADRMLAAGS